MPQHQSRVAEGSSREFFTKVIETTTGLVLEAGEDDSTLMPRSDMGFVRDLIAK